MYFQHVSPDEAVEIHQDVKSNFSLGIHWGTFNLSFEVSAAAQPTLTASYTGITLLESAVHVDLRVWTCGTVDL